MTLDQLVSNIIIGGAVLIGIATFLVILWLLGGSTIFRQVAKPILKLIKVKFWNDRIIFEEPAGWQSYKSFAGRFYQSPHQKTTTISYIEPRKDLTNIVLSPFENPAGLGISMVTVPDEHRKKLKIGAFEEIDDFEVSEKRYKRKFVVFQKGAYYLLLILNCHENDFEAGNKVLNRMVNTVSWTHE
jgi:hypothetical protein